MNKIVKTIMERDNLDQQDAEDLYSQFKSELTTMLDEVLADCNAYDVHDMACSLMEDFFGLEPDYLDETLFELI